MEANALAKWYWRGALFVPPIVALAGRLMSPRFAGGYGRVLAWGFAIESLPYAIFAALMWWALGKVESAQQGAPLLLAAPTLMLGIVVPVGFVAVAVAAVLFHQPWALAVYVPFFGVATWLVGEAFVVVLVLLFAPIWFASSRAAKPHQTVPSEF